MTQAVLFTREHQMNADGLQNCRQLISISHANLSRLSRGLQVVAGLEPENTNLFLQMLAEAALAKAAGRPAQVCSQRWPLPCLLRGVYLIRGWSCCTKLVSGFPPQQALRFWCCIC